MLGMVAESSNVAGTSNVSFKASWSWAYGFMKRLNYSLRKATTCSNSNNAEIATKVDGFIEMLKDLLKMNNYSDDNIVNVDETPVWFNCYPQLSLHKRGDKQVPIHVSSQDKRRVTVTLAVTKSGKMLPPSIIEKSFSKAADLTPGSTRREVNGISIWKQRSNTMTGDIMVSWIQNVLKPMFPNKHEKKLIILDSFSGHTIQSVK